MNESTRKRFETAVRNSRDLTAIRHALEHVAQAVRDLDVNIRLELRYAKADVEAEERQAREMAGQS